MFQLVCKRRATNKSLWLLSLFDLGVNTLHAFYTDNLMIPEFCKVSYCIAMKSKSPTTIRSIPENVNWPELSEVLLISLQELVLASDPFLQHLDTSCHQLAALFPGTHQLLPLILGNVGHRTQPLDWVQLKSAGDTTQQCQELQKEINVCWYVITNRGW